MGVQLSPAELGRLQGRTRLRRVGALRHICAGLLTLGIIAPAAATASTGPPVPTPEIAAATPESDLTGVGSDGGSGVWFSDIDSSQSVNKVYLAHYTPQAGLSLANIDPQPPDNGQTWGIAAGPSGEEWFARLGADQVSRIAPDGTITDTTLTSGAAPYGIAVDRAGTVWFTERHGCYLARLAPDGTLSEYTVGSDCWSNPVIGPNGNIWVTLGPSNQVVEVSATTGDVLARYILPGETMGIASLDGLIWVAEYNNSRIASISPTGHIKEYKLAGGLTYPEYLAAGEDGAIWFTTVGSRTNSYGGIGRITPSGQQSKVLVPGGARGIAATRGGVYYTQENGPAASLMRIPLTSLIPATGSYAALGDSYSSGEGNPPYEPGSDDASYDKCHRSESAYALLLDGERGLGPIAFKACSGAVTDDLFNENSANHEPAQLTALSTATKVVTLTIGGDDAGFVHVLNECVAGPRVSWWPYHGYGCSEQPALRAETTSALNALEGSGSAWAQGRTIHSIASVIAEIHHRAENAQIVIGGYPLLFGSHTKTYSSNPFAPSTKVCIVAPGEDGGSFFSVDYLDAQWINEQGSRLDSIILGAVNAAKAAGVPVSYAAAAAPFSGHSLCDSRPPWFHPLELEGASGPEKSSFHPNNEGQVLGYATAFRKQVK
jgi:streptogramin lyase